jgi:hypothetical protein
MEECSGLPSGVTLHRKLELTQDGRCLSVRDRVEGIGKHIVERFFVVGDVQSLVMQGSTAIIQFDEGRLDIESRAPESVHIGVQEISISDSFGELRRGSVLRYRHEVSPPAAMETYLRWTGN